MDNRHLFVRMAKKYGPKRSMRSKGMKKRSRKTAKRGRTRRTTVVTGIPRPPRVIVRLPYVTSLKMGAGVGGGITGYLLNTNSLFDPDRSGIGHQPLGFDEWKAMGYNKYRVFACDYDISIVSNSQSAPCRAVVNAQNTSTVPGDDSFFESVGARDTRIIEYGSGPKRFKGRVSLPNILGMTNEQYRTNTLTASQVTASPSEIATLVVAISPLDNTSSVNCYATCRLTYYAELYDPSPITLSATKPGQEEGATHV